MKQPDALAPKFGKEKFIQKDIFKDDNGDEESLWDSEIPKKQEETTQKLLDKVSLK